MPTGAGTPTGAVFCWPTAAAPTGYLLCDGSAVSRTTYSDLFTLLSTTYGVGDGSTTFNLPNLKGRAVVGLDAAQTEFDALGETGGAKTVTLDVTMIPSHTHVQDPHTHVQNSHNHTQDAHGHTVQSTSSATGTSTTIMARGSTNSGNFTVANATATNQAATAVNQNATATNQSTGGGLAHANLQPYLVLNYIIKT